MSLKISLYFLRSLSVFSFIFLLSLSAFSQNCNCAVTIPLTQTLFDGAKTKVLPGQTICIASGTRTFLTFRNILGDSLNPIIIKNCGGQAYFNSFNGYGIQVASSRYFKITGTGSADNYGIKINLNNQGSQGLTLHTMSSNFELDHLEIYNTGFAGIMAKTDPNCNGIGNKGNFTMYDVKFHHNYIHHTGGEAFYVGFSFPAGYSKKAECKGTVLYPHDIIGCKIYNNKTNYTSADGIQVTGVSSGFALYNNEILNYGQNPFGNFQNSGIALGPVTKGPIYNNIINSGGGNGITVVSGSGDNLIYNNLIINAGAIGIFVDERPPIVYGAGYRIINNTIINSIDDGIRLYSDLVAMNHVKNNAILNPATGKYLVKLNKSVKVTEQNNYYKKLVESAKLNTSTSGNYSLKFGSPLIDAGQNVSSYGITTDYAGMPRPVGSSYDIGAYEYQGSSGNSLPSINSGNDQSVALPQNSLQLTGIASDVDGNISSWLWIKQSGPSATLSGTTSNKLSVNNLVEGVYVFRCTVTDNLGGQSWDETTVTVTAGNLAPTAILTTSAFSGSLLINSPLTLTAEATDVDGTISKVAFMNGNTLLVEDFSSPFTYTTSPQTAGLQSYHVIATDNKGTQTISANKQVTIITGVSCLGSGTILREQWNNLSGSSLSGQNLDALIPTSSSLLTEISIISNVGDNYASRMRGYICAPLSGNYTFWIAGDDNCELWLSTDGSSANKQKIATVIGWSNVGEYTKYSGQQSALINLTAGQNYYIEVLQKEATGEDHVSVGWRLPEGTLERPISSNRISAYVNQVPVAQTGSEITLTLPEDSVVLYSSSYDIDGSILNYSWTKQQGNGTIKGNSNGSTLSVKNLGVGAHIYRLTVTDNSGAQHFVDQKITVKTANLAPISNAGINQTLTLPQNSITLNGFGSDQDGSIVDYLWTQINGPAATMQQVYTPNLRLSNLVTGSYTFRLMAMDNMGLTSTDDAVVTVLPGIKTVVYRVNCGGPLLTDLPIDWAADDADLTSEYFFTSGINEINRVQNPILSTIPNVPNMVFSDYRFDSPAAGSINYSFPVTNGDYEVKLYFAENNNLAIPKTRVFDVMIEGNLELDDYNIFTKAGLNSKEEVIRTTIYDGTIDIDFVQVISNPLISGIEIVSVGGTSTNVRQITKAKPAFEKIEAAKLNAVIYPNPYQDDFTIEIESAPETSILVEIFDLLGKKLIAETYLTTNMIQKIIINTSKLNLNYGVYLVRIAAKDFATQTIKVVKQ